MTKHHLQSRATCNVNGYPKGVLMYTINNSELCPTLFTCNISVLRSRKETSLIQSKMKIGCQTLRWHIHYFIHEIHLSYVWHNLRQDICQQVLIRIFKFNESYLIPCIYHKITNLIVTQKWFKMAFLTGDLSVLKYGD